MAMDPVAVAPRSHRWGPIAIFVFTVVASGFVILDGLAPVSGFTSSHYLFTYQDGFLRRALIGSAVALLRSDAPVPEELPGRIGLVFLGLLVCLTGLLAAAAWRRGRPDAVVLLIGLFVGASQLRILAFDVGKFDTLLLVLTVGSALCALGPPKVAHPVVGLLSVLGVLSHELHLVAGVPLAVAMVALRSGQDVRTRVRAALLAAAPATMVGVALAIVAGAPPGGSAAAANARMVARAGFEVRDSAAFIQDLSVLESIRMTISVVLGRPTAILVSVLVALPTIFAGLVLLRGTLRRGWLKNDGDVAVLMMSALSPLALLPLGFDWYRWLTIAAINTIAAALWRQASGAQVGAADAGSISDRSGPIVIGLVLTCILLGSISLSTALSALTNLLS